MHGACAPVAAATRGYHKLHPQEIKEVGVAWDGSPEAREAVLLAAALARRESARLRLITVDVRETTLPGLIGWEPPVPKTPAEVLKEGVDLVSPDLEVVGKLLDGNSIPAAIAEECRVGVELLVVGSRGYGALGRVLLGSVGTDLLHHSLCPVIAVPRPPTPRGEQSF
jgi:nucleotide-binding universal stress UspA family protein